MAPSRRLLATKHIFSSKPSGRFTQGKTKALLGDLRGFAVQKDSVANLMELKPLHFHDHTIEVVFDTPPALEKSPDCPNGFIWEDKTYRVVEMLSAWSDFTRRGKMARNMRPAHAATASTRGSLNVGRFYFRVKVDTNQIFDIYYDRAMKNVDDRKGQWFLYREMGEE